MSPVELHTETGTHVLPDSYLLVGSAAARHAGAEAIVTRDPKGFTTSRLKLYAPDELLRFPAAAPEA